MLNAILYIAEHDCKCRGLPKCFGNWHTICTRMNQWTKTGVLSDVLATPEGTDCAYQDRSGVVGLHQLRAWVCSKSKRLTSRRQVPRRMESTRIHLVVANARTAITFSPSPGQAHDATEGRALLRRSGQLHLLMDRACEGNQTRQLSLDLGYWSVVPLSAK